LSLEDHGYPLLRGGGEIPVGRTPESFTCVVRRPAEVEQLQAAPEIGTVERLTRTVVRASVIPAVDVEDLRDATMRSLREDGGLIVHHEYQRLGDPATTYQLTDELIARFRPDVPTARLATRFDEAGLVVKKAYLDLENAYLLRVTDQAAANPLKVAMRLADHADTIYAEPVLVNSFAPASLPTDDRFPHQWHLAGRREPGPDIAPDAGISAVQAWEVTKGSRDIVVAVLDDGFDLRHPDFGGDGKVVDPVDFVGDDDNPAPEDGDYHGTPCAGLAIAEENGYGCVGVAPGCAFMPVRIPFKPHDSWMIELFQYVSLRAHVASCSWSLPPGFHPLNRAVAETLTRVTSRGGRDGRGLVVVFAAGNFDAPITGRCDEPVRWSELGVMGAPRMRSQLGQLVSGLQAHAGVITVSACTSLNRKALYSNWGAEVAVAAPSNNRDPTAPTNPLPGRGITTTDNEPPVGSDYQPGKRYTDSFGGTSAACPQVAGVAALVKSANPLLRARDVKAIIQATATKISDPDADALYPANAFGTYDADGHSPWFGYGKVDADAAVRAAAARASARTVVELTAPGFRVPAPEDAGIAGVLPVSDTRVVADLELAIELDGRPGAGVRVLLTGPARAAVALDVARAGRTTFALEDLVAPGGLTGRPAAGDWLLRAVAASDDTSCAIRRWGLRLTLFDEPADQRPGSVSEPAQ